MTLNEHLVLIRQMNRHSQELAGFLWERLQPICKGCTNIPDCFLSFNCMCIDEREGYEPTCLNKTVNPANSK